MAHDIETFEVPFGRVGGRTLRLWVNRPRGRGPFPAMMDLHGGGWTHFDHHVDFYWCQELARRGFAMCSVEFRLAPEDRWPAFISDIRAASRWLHVHGPSIGVDPDAVGAIGGSTGGHLAILLGITPTDPDPRHRTQALDTPDDAEAGIDWVAANYPIVDVAGRYRMVLERHFSPAAARIGDALLATLRRRAERAGTPHVPGHPPRLGNPTALARLDALRARRPRLGDAVGWTAQRLLWGIGHVPALERVEYFGLRRAHEGAFRDEEDMDAASPTRIVREGRAEKLPPMIIQQGHDDPNMTDAMTQTFADLVRARGGEVELRFLARHGHGFGNVPSPQADRMIDRVERFARAAIRRTPARIRSAA